MDLNLYYQKMREQQAAIKEEFPVVVSHETADGGKSGHFTEVAKRVAARLLVQGLARLANSDEVAKFRQAQAEALRKAEELAAAAKMQFTVVAASELERLNRAAKTKG